MKNPNLGTLDRAIRLALSSFIFIWLSSQETMGALEWVAAIAALFLLLNAVFARCYLWSWFKIDTCGGDFKNCTNNDSCN